MDLIGHIPNYIQKSFKVNGGMKDKYFIVATYFYDDETKYYETSETIEMEYKNIVKQVNRYYKKGAEAVELELIEENIDISDKI